MDPASATWEVLKTVYEVVGAQGIVKFLTAHNDKERIQAFLDAEYAAADAIADKAEAEKLGNG